MCIFIFIFIEEEDYQKKAKDIFSLINKFRKNPKELAIQLELTRTYLDKNTNILSEPNKIQLQMVEGDNVIKEAIQFLSNLPPLKELQWDENLCRSAQEHVDDIGPKGLLQYQSSDGTEPENRITKYGSYIGNLGENIDFGPSDTMQVIIFLTLDDGEKERPHRLNLFNTDYQKIGIACGPHKTEYEMCVMDFADDFIPLNSIIKQSNNKLKNIEEELNKENNDLKNNEEKLKKEIEKKENEVEELKNKNNNIQKELNDIKKSKQEIELKLKKMENDYNIKNNKLKESNNEIIKLKEELNRSKKIIETQKKEIEQFKKQYNSQNQKFGDKLKDFDKLEALIVRKDIEINELKQKLLQNNNIINMDNKNKEKKIDKCVCFVSSDHEITYAIPCSGESTFAEVEEKLYQEYSRYRETNNTFLANGKEVLRFKTINYNSIGNGKPVLLIVPS